MCNCGRRRLSPGAKSKTNLRQRGIDVSGVKGWRESEQDNVHVAAEVGEGVDAEEGFGDIA